MKQFIILMGILPFLFLFMLQYTLEQKNSHHIARFQEHVYTAKEKAKQEGRFTQEIQKELVKKIAADFDLREEDIQVNLEQLPKYRTNVFDERELIYYKVSAPIEKIMAGNNFLGISDDKNSYMYTIESWTASEFIGD